MKKALARYLYTFLYYCLTPFVLLRLIWRGRKAPGYLARWGERFGRLDWFQGCEGVIWIHAVSVGETLAALPLIRALQQQRPKQKILVTTTTPTGSERVTATLGDSVYHCYAPYDLPGPIKRVLAVFKPVALIVMETELWPNLIYYCHAQGVPVLIANARLSERSARGYRRVAPLTEAMLQKLSGIAVQTAVERQRFIELGAPEARVAVTGNIKFDVRLDAELQHQAEELKQALSGEGQRPVFLAASTHRGEDDIILDAYLRLQKQFGDLLLIIAPRHPERFDEVGKLVQQHGLPLVRRSLGEFPSRQGQVMLCDTMGELLLFYGACDIAFVGGSLTPVGGHNMLEPAAWGVPVICGPHLFNFAEVSQLLAQADALTICQAVDDLVVAIESLLQNPVLRRRKGMAAQLIVTDNQGALERLLTVIQQTLER